MHIIKLETIIKYTTEHGTNYHQRHSKELSTAGRDTESIYRLHADNKIILGLDSMILAHQIHQFIPLHPDCRF